MANGNPFAPQGNPFGRSAPGMFAPTQEPFDKALMKKIPIGKPITGNALLSQVPGRYVDVQASEKLNQIGKEWEGMAEEQMPAATPAPTEPLTSPLAMPQQANAAPLTPAQSQYAYQLMPQEQRDANVNELLGVLGADMARYEPGYVDPWDTSGESRSGTRSKYEDILANFAADGGSGNANIYNRWGLPEDYYRNFLIPYLQENAPQGQTINDIGAASGSRYDQLKSVLDTARKNKGPTDMERYVAPALNTILTAIATWGIGSGLGAALGTGTGTVAGAGTAAEAGMSALPGAGVGLASEGGLASLAPVLASSSGSMFSALPALSGAGEGLASEGLPISSALTASTSKSALESVLKSPITRKLVGEALNQMMKGGGEQPSPYYFQGIPEEYAATQQSPLASAVTSLDELYPGEGGYTYAQMTREPAAEAVGAGASNPFLRKKAAKDAMSRIRQYKSQL